MSDTMPAPHEMVTDHPISGPNAQARVHARETEPRGGGHGTPVTVATAAVPKILAGTSPMFEQPASLAAVWDLHVRSARYFEFGPWRLARYSWGCLHISIASGCYLLAWGTRSFPMGLVLLGLVIAAVFLF